MWFLLQIMRTHWREASPEELAETCEEQIQIFKEATALKAQLILDENSGAESDEEKMETISVKILADLQENQDTEASYLLRDLSKKVSHLFLRFCYLGNFKKSHD